MIDRRSLTLAIGAAAFVAARPASATGQRFTQAAFDAAQGRGQADPRRGDRAMVPHLPGPAADPSEVDGRAAFRELVFLSVDFDSQKDVVRALNVRSQSTLVVFKGRPRSAGPPVTPTRRASPLSWRRASDQRGARRETTPCCHHRLRLRSRDRVDPVALRPAHPAHRARRRRIRAPRGPLVSPPVSRCPSPSSASLSPPSVSPSASISRPSARWPASSCWRSASP